MAYVSDRFDGKAKQTPFFVTQADYTEVFCSVDDDLRNALRPYVAGSPNPSTPAGTTKADLVARIQARAADFGSEEEAQQTLLLMETALREHPFGPELSALFTPEVTTSDEYPPRAVEIGKWLNELQKSDVVFAKPTTKSEQYTARVPKSHSIASLSFLTSIHDEDDDEKFKTVFRTRKVVTGYETTADMPYKYLKCHLKPSVVSIGPERLYIAVLVSRTNTFIFYRFVSFDYSGWDETRVKSFTEWQVERAGLRASADVEALVHKIAEMFERRILEKLQDEFPSEEDVSSSEGASGNESPSGVASKPLSRRQKAEGKPEEAKDI
jgi:hypothetical protein